MNILHTVCPGEFGGLERVVVQLCGGLRERGHEVTVAAVLADGAGSHPFVRALEERSVEVVVVESAGRRYGREIQVLGDLASRLEPDVLHTHGYRADVLHSRVARRCAIPRVTTVHGFTGGGLKNRLYEWLQIRALRSFDAIVCVSSPMARMLGERGVPESRLEVVRNAWRPFGPLESRATARAALGVSDQVFHVGWVGRVSAEKGPDLFLKALGSVAEERLDMTASIVGDGPMRSELEKRARDDRALSDVRFHGAVEDAERLFPGFDVFVLSSRTEGTPMVLFEAMEAGVPIVANAVGGVPDVLSPDIAHLVAPGDGKALAARILDTLRDPEGAARRARAARLALARDFAEGPWLAEYERVYASVAGL